MKVKQNAINIIFAITSDQINIYKRLSDHIEGSYAGTLSNDSSNIVELVKDQYNVSLYPININCCAKILHHL